MTSERYKIYKKHKNLESYKSYSIGGRHLFTILRNTCLFLSIYRSNSGKGVNGYDNQDKYIFFMIYIGKSPKYRTYTMI